VKLASALPALLFSLFLQFTFADQVVMKNGDRLSGTIEKYDDKNLLLKTDYAGELDWSAVQQITSTELLHVSLSTGQTVKARSQLPMATLRSLRRPAR